LQTGLFIVGSLCQHPEPDEMALESPLKREMGTIFIVKSNALGIPVERRHALEDGLERLHIQREARKHDGAIMFSTDEFHGCGIDDEFHELVILMIPPSQLSHRTVRFHAVRHGLNEFCHP
jgi:hypothetical protein